MQWLRRLRERAYSEWFDVEGGKRIPRLVEKTITWLIVTNLVALVVEHIPVLQVQIEDFLSFFDKFSIVVFTIEHILRLFCSAGMPRFRAKFAPATRYSFTPFALIDLLVIAPYWLHFFGVIDLDLRALRIFRLLRLLKLMRDFIPATRRFIKDNRGLPFRQKIHALMNETPTSGRLQRYVDLIFIIFIIGSVLAVLLETVPEIHTPLKVEFEIFDTVSVAVFTLEFLLRLYAAPEVSTELGSLGARLKFLRRPSTFVDVVAVLPFYLQALSAVDLRFVRILRALRILKLTRYNTALKTFATVMAREKRAFAAALFITMLITILGGAIVYEVEHHVQPDKFDTMFRALYWAVITLASVGYGDISPVTPIGQAMTMLLALLGIGIVALPAGILGSAFSDELQQQRLEMEQEIAKAFEDGILTDEEAKLLEEERIRLHVSKEQFQKLRQRAEARHSKKASVSGSVIQAGDQITRLREQLHALPSEEAIVEIGKLDLNDSEKAALRALLK